MTLPPAAAGAARPGNLPRAMLVLLVLAVLLNYVDRGNLSTASPLLQDELGLSSAQLGLLLSAFFWVYAPAQPLAGWLAHRFDIRVVLGAGVALWALATMLTGLVGAFGSLLALRLLLGLGESVTFPCAQLLLARHTAEHERGRLNGLLGAGQGIGPMLGTLFGGLAMAHYGWRAMFVSLGVITLLWLWPWTVVTRRGALHVPETHDTRAVPYAQILRRREFWGAALGHFCSNYPFYFVLSWLPTFLVKNGGFSVAQMAQIGALIYALYALSTFAVGAASDAWVRAGGAITRVRKTMMLVGAVGTAATILGSALVPPRDAVWLLGAGGVFFGFTTPMIFTIGTTLAGPRAAGRWTGAQNLAGQAAGILGPIVTGMILDHAGFGPAFVLTAGVALCSAVGWCVMIRRIEPLRWD